MSKQRPTLSEVATAANVSAMTASRAMNNRPGVSSETREHVLKVAAELGYVVNRAAQKLSGGRSHIIGIVATDLEHPFVSAVATGAREAAWTAGYEVLVYAQLRSEKRPTGGVLQLLRQISDGIIAALPMEYGYLEDLAELSIPVVTIDQRGNKAEFPSIAADSYGGAKSAILHLAELGHKRIALIGGDERLGSARDRRRAYNETMAQLGFRRDSALVAPGDYSQAGGYAAAQKLLALSSRPTAILAANDVSAFGAMTAIREAGLRIPEDISVVGFDDIPASSLVSPALTTVRQPIYQMGRSAVNTLLALMARIEPATQVVSLPTELVIRQSTAAPKS
ncbi:LacI family DNA-binding transcriptional regulator [Niveibacterium sp. SC-1]|uniref:LacI family DNA-binding transcriptional regulator n=1 Tax=Niveibacterium sp. SC-1 TaxID=3135646 RepID=UPI00312003E6